MKESRGMCMGGLGHVYGRIWREEWKERNILILSKNKTGKEKGNNKKYP